MHHFTSSDARGGLGAQGGLRGGPSASGRPADSHRRATGSSTTERLTDGRRASGGTRIGSSGRAATETLRRADRHDAENDPARCLASVWHIADEILIGDTGSTDTTTRWRRSTARGSSRSTRSTNSPRGSPARATPSSTPAPGTGSSGSTPRDADRGAPAAAGTL